jgi:uncharacterized protein (DUF2249 family)
MPASALPPRDDHATDDTIVALDLRALPAPEPMMRALEAADALLPGQTVELLTPLLPTPLLDLLANRRLHVRAEMLPAGGARVWVHRPDDDGPTGA